MSSPTSDSYLRQITLKCRRFQTIVIATVTTQPYRTVFTFVVPDYINTVLYLSSWQQRLYTQRSASNFSSISFRCNHSQEKLSPSKMYSHGTSRPKPPPLLPRFPFMTTFPQLVCLFKNLVNQVAINLGTWPMTSNSLFKIFGWRSTARSVLTWSGFGLTTATAFTSFSFFWLTHRLIHIF